MLKVIVFLFAALLCKNDLKARSGVVNKNISVVNADSFEKVGNTFYLRGNVHLKDKLLEIRADEIKYDQSKNSIVAKGNVYLSDDKGNIYYAEEMDLADSFKKGKINNIHIMLYDRSRIAAKESVIDLSNVSTAKYIKYSSCESCKNNRNKPLVWQIDADEIKYDHVSENMYYKNAIFRFFGAPIFFFPRFTQPSPKVERRSGFLTPKLIFSQKLGVIGINSYVFALSRSSELLAKLALTTKSDRLFFGEYNKKYLNADIHFGFSITDNVKLTKYLHDDLSDEEKSIADKIKRRGFRGHIDAKLNVWNKLHNSRVFANVKLLSDKSYFNRYTFIPNQDENELNFEKSFYETNLGFETFTKHNYAIVKLITFQNTLTNDKDYETPFIAPYSEIDITKPLDKFVLGGNLNLYMSFMNCDFKGGIKDRKLFGKLSYIKNYVASNGMVFDCNISLLLHLINARNQTINGKNQINNISPKVSFKMSYPIEILYKNGNMGIFSPEGRFISSLTANKDFEGYLKYSNEFSDYFEINKSNLLYDDVNTDINNCFIENRFIVGMNYEHYLSARKLFDIFVGQMFFAEKPKYDPNKGISNDKVSDIFVSGGIYLHENLSLNYNVILASSFKSCTRHNIFVNLVNDKFFVRGGITNGDMYNMNKNKTHFETFFIDARYSINNRYDVFAGKQFGDKNCKSLSHYFGCRYQDECFMCELKLERIFYRKVDCNNDTRIILSFNLKNLGEFQINQKISSQKDDRRPYGYY